VRLVQGEAVAFALGGNRKMLRTGSLAGLLNQELAAAGHKIAEVRIPQELVLLCLPILCTRKQLLTAVVLKPGSGLLMNLLAAGLNNSSLLTCCCAGHPAHGADSQHKAC
jgi:hypothetical protein